MYYAEKDVIGKHVLVNDPEQADLIAFIESSFPNFSDVRHSSIYRQYKSRAVLFNSADRCIPTIPGVYACLERRMSRAIRHALAGFYIRVADDEALDAMSDIEEREYLYSFVGNAQRHRVRRRLCRSEHDVGLVLDTSDAGLYDNSRGRYEGMDYKQRYLKVMEQSKFVLCLRGQGTNTWRLFETMRAGRAPVIVSDAWVPMSGPNWEEFSVRVKERHLGSIPAVLEEMESSAQMMGQQARRAWEMWFGEDRVFNTTVDLLQRANRLRGYIGFIEKAMLYANYIDPYFFRHWCLSPIKRRLWNRLGMRT